MIEKEIKIKYSNNFNKQLRKIPGKIIASFNNRLEVFKKDSFHPLLNNHELTGIYKGFRSINVTGDYRAIYRETIDEEGTRIIIFSYLGTHSQLYK